MDEFSVQPDIFYGHWARGRSTEGLSGMPRGPSRRSGNDKEKLPNLFEWAESFAAKRGRKLDDVSAVSTKAVPVILSLLAAGWWQVSEDSPTRILLAAGTMCALVLTILTWGTRAFQSNIENKGLSIALHGLSFVGAVVVLCAVMCGILVSDLDHAAQRDKQADKSAAEKEQVLKDEQKKKLDHEAEEQATRAQEAHCQKLRDAAVKTARIVHKNASKALVECKAEFASHLFNQKTVEQHCKTQSDLVDGAKSSVTAANSRICSTGSIKSDKQ